jgi:hypothetical protein
MHAAPGCSRIYVVKRGDTLGAIAKSSGTTVAAFVALNPDIKNPDEIEVAQRLCIPGETCAPSKEFYLPSCATLFRDPRICELIRRPQSV